MSTENVLLVIQGVVNIFTKQVILQLKMGHLRVWILASKLEFQDQSFLSRFQEENTNHSLQLSQNSESHSLNAVSACNMSLH